MNAIECPGCKSRHPVSDSLEVSGATCKKCATTFDPSAAAREVAAILAEVGETAEATVPETKKKLNGFDYDQAIGNLALKYKLIGPVQLEGAKFQAKQAAATGKPISLARVMLATGIIDYAKLKCLMPMRDMMATRHYDCQMGKFAVQKGWLRQQDLAQALDIQKKRFKQHKKINAIGDWLVDEGKLKLEQRDAIESRQTRPQPEILPPINEVVKAPLQPKPGGGEPPTTQQPSAQANENDLNGPCTLADQAVDQALAEQSDCVAEAETPHPDTAAAVSPAASESKSDSQVNPAANPGATPDEGLESASGTAAAVDSESPTQIQSEQTESEQAVPDSDVTPAAAKGRSKAAKSGNWVELTVAKDRLSAAITVKELPPPDFSAAHLKSWLTSKGLHQGLLADDQLAACVAGKIPLESPVVVAEGLAPLQGQDAVIEYRFDIEKPKVGTETAGGAIDFKDKGKTPNAKAGEVLVQKVPLCEGNPGTDVYGRTLTPPLVKDVPLRAGKGAELSEDKLQIVAAIDGMPKKSITGRIEVLPIMEVSGDVDLRTGHIDFDGEIVVTGTVQSGYRVTGMRLVAGEILKAEINVAGDIEVEGGIKGATIKAGGDVRATYIRECRIKALGDVVATAEIIDSEVESSGVCMVNEGPILSSKANAKKGILAKQIGSDSSKPCLLTVGVDQRSRNEIGQYEARIEEIKEAQAVIENQVHELKAKERQLEVDIGVKAQVQDRAMLKQRDLQNAVEKAKSVGDQNQVVAIQQALETLKQGVKEHEKALEALFDKQDGISDEIAENNKHLAAEASRKQDIEAAIDEINQWSQQDPATAEVTVLKKIHAFTRIAGPHTTVNLKREHVRTLLCETQYRKKDESIGWKFKAAPLV